MGLFDSLLKKEKTSAGQQPKAAAVGERMLSQYAAMYCDGQDEGARSAYLSHLAGLALPEKEAQALLDFECAVIRKHPKAYLLHPDFVKMWFFGLRQPFFQQDPKTKPDIMKEQFFTISELCKIIDEAEWHYWNSHEKNLSDSVWTEICAWRLKGPGGEFAIKYFAMIAAETGVPMEHLAAVSSDQGEYLSHHKWH